MTGLKRKILKSGTLITAGTMVSRLLGFLREILAAAFFGGGRLYDAFVVAFTIPALFRRILGEEMFERAFMPPFERMRAEGKSVEARKFIFKLLVALSLILAVLVVILLVFMKPLVAMLAPGMDPATQETAVLLGKQILPFLVLISFSTFTGALLLFSERNLTYSLAPAAMNVGIIVVLLLFHQSLGITAMVLACVAGSACFLLVQLPAAFHVIRSLKREEGETGDAPIGPPMREGRRIFISALATKGTEVADKIVGSLVGAGAISSLWYAFRIIHLPFAILGLAISRAIAPELSRLRGSRNYRDFGRIIHFGLDLNLFLLIPVTVFFMMFSREIVTLFYYRGAFSLDAVNQTSLAFFYYGLSLAPMGMAALLGRIFSAFENNRAPMIAAAVAAVLHIILDLVLYRTPLKQGGIALATAISQTTQVVLLFWALRRYPVRLKATRLLASLSQLAFSMVVFVGLLIAGRMLMPVTLHFLPLLCWLGGIAGVAFLFYGFVVYGFLRNRGGRKCKVLLTGGGTGGHVYPALAIYRILLDKNRVSEVRYLGLKGRAEEIIVPRHNIPLNFVPSAPVAGGSPFQQVKAGFTILGGTIKSMGHILRYKPHLVIATGGYASAPVVFAAFLLKPFLKLRIVIDEQNLVPGLLNKVASALADTVLVNFRESAYFMWSNRCLFTGYPVRSDYLKPVTDRQALRQKLGVPEDHFCVVVSGGSMGARSINRALASVAHQFKNHDKLHIVHSVGLSDTSEYPAWADTVERIQHSCGDSFNPETGQLIGPNGSICYQAHPYLHNLFEYQQAADLLVCRAGAGSLAEAMALGIPTLLIPKRGLPGDHQELNAISVAEHQAAELLFERRDPETGVDILDGEDLLNEILRLKSDEARRLQLADATARFRVGDTADRITDAIDLVMEGGEVEGVSQIVEPRFVRFQRTFDNLITFLDHNARQSRDNLYVRLFNLKVEEFVACRSMLTVNKGIKLIGSLKRQDLYPFLYENFGSFQGFLKRNALAALAKAEQFEAPMADLVAAGLNDAYFETRREAIHLYSRFHDSLVDRTDLQEQIRYLMNRRLESFEVKCAAIGASVHFMEPEQFMTDTEPFLFARNVRYREALLDAVRDGLARGRFTDIPRLRRFLGQMLITTSQFQPTFLVRQRFINTLKKLEETSDDQASG